jgi:prepilin-type N-terminal cleavage/methylation domain-containing protein
MKILNLFRLPRREYTPRNDGVRGFTLLELLVVIGIIGVLMALATVAYSSTQKSGRNTRRKQDLVSIQNALELYYSSNGFVYPTGNCSGASDYLKSSWPVDPTSNTAYTGDSSCTATSYCICGVMEGTTTGGNSAANCAFSGTKDNYCVSNLQ